MVGRFASIPSRILAAICRLGVFRLILGSDFEKTFFTNLIPPRQRQEVLFGLSNSRSINETARGVWKSGGMCYARYRGLMKHRMRPTVHLEMPLAKFAQ